jgi:hypothetical protein
MKIISDFVKCNICCTNGFATISLCVPAVNVHKVRYLIYKIARNASGNCVRRQIKRRITEACKRVRLDVERSKNSFVWENVNLIQSLDEHCLFSRNCNVILLKLPYLHFDDDNICKSVYNLRRGGEFLIRKHSPRAENSFS